MNRIFSTLATSILGLLIVSCTGEIVDYSEPTVTPPEIIPPEVTDLPTDIPDITIPTIASAPLSSIPAEIIENFNDFSLRFYLANSEGNKKNVCVSPLSVGAVLGMLANGDDGESRDGILKMMGFEENQKGLDALNTYYQTLLSNLPNIEEGITCNMTNTLWCDPSRYGIIKSFMESIADCYYAYGIGINPSGDAGKNAINMFVDKNTNGLIKDFLKKPLESELAFLNTLYFKAGWSEAFVEWETYERIFVDIEGNEQVTDFMSNGEFAEYAVTEDGTEAVRFNYGELKQFSMMCILPSSSISHTDLDEVLTLDNINDLNNNMKYMRAYVCLPKFEIEMNNPNTLSILTSMGMKDSSKFGLITDVGEFYLNSFIHATKIKVDENGTEGAAVSLAEMTTGVHGPVPNVVFDRPFIFYIQENTTGTILFIGSVKTFS
ncbi:MAG: hypothetical protein K2N35_00605 [Muribaculaceae bacterium]|nr:hypothetical protein [Muribaculaceae bacterium]